MRRSRSSVGARRCGARAVLGRRAAEVGAAAFRAAGRVVRFGAAFFLADALAGLATGLRVFLAAAFTTFLRLAARRRGAARRLAERRAVRRDALAVPLRAPRAFLFAMDRSFRDLDKMS